MTAYDEFDSGELGPNWNTLRVPFTDAMGTVGGGHPMRVTNPVAR